jgi:hypothetical protein
LNARHFSAHTSDKRLQIEIRHRKRCLREARAISQAKRREAGCGDLPVGFDIGF